MQGYVVIADGGRYLDKSMSWKIQEVEEAYVFSKEQTRDILKKAKAENWEIKPSFICPAKKDEEKTVINGFIENVA